MARRNDSKRAQRRGTPIHAYVGANGGGKSLAAVWDTLPSLAAGRPVLSTVRLLDYSDPRPCPGGKECDDESGHERPEGVHAAAHPLYIPFRDYSQLLEFRGGDVLLDEVTGIASSRESHSMPVQVANYLVQLRRRDVMMRWTTPNWARADKIIREVTQGATYCVGYLPKTRVAEDGSARLWRDRRMFVWRTYDAAAFDDFTEGKRQTLRARPTDFFWRPGSAAEVAYDTLDQVMALGWANEAGLCMSCGGRRSHRKCECVTHSPRSLDKTIREIANDGLDEAAAAVEPKHARLPRAQRRGHLVAARNN